MTHQRASQSVNAMAAIPTTAVPSGYSMHSAMTQRHASASPYIAPPNAALMATRNATTPTNARKERNGHR